MNNKEAGYLFTEIQRLLLLARSSNKEEAERAAKEKAKLEAEEARKDAEIEAMRSKEVKIDALVSC